MNSLFLFWYWKKCFQLSTIEYDVSCKFVVYDLYYVEKVPSKHTFWRYFIKNWCWICQKLFWIYRNYNILQFFNVVYHNEYFVYIEDSLHPGINSIWFGYMSLLIWCWILLSYQMSVFFLFFFLTVFLSLINFYSHNIMVQLSHPYMTTGKAIALTRWTSVGKVMSLLFNMLSRS